MKKGYRQLQGKMFFRTVVLMGFAVVFTFGIYIVILQGRFANAVVGFLDRFLYQDYDTALYVYKRTVRDNAEVIVLLAILAVFFIALRLHLRSFAKYFNEINQGLDALLEENEGEVSLSQELSETERKINDIKRALVQRKLAAEAAENRKNELVVYLAHDLKTPLTSVIGYLTLLHDESQISEELRQKYLSIALEKSERLEELINEFFEITRFNLSNLVLEYGQVNVTRLLEQLTFEFQPMLREKNLRCVLEAAPDMMVECDADKMQRVFDNLLKNAVNYSSENGEIRVSAAWDGEGARVTFENPGHTIPAEKLERIFEQFYRLDSARSSKSGGSGLGLAIAKEIVELHQGRITAKSGDGRIVFEVFLPRTPDGPAL